MAPLPHNNTAIYYLDYTVDAREHTLEVRFDGAVSPAAFGASIGGLFVDNLANLDLLTVLGVRHQVQGSNVSNPVTSGIEGNTYGSGVAGADNVPKYINFIGRSSGGRRVRMMIFGYKGAISTWRLTTAENAGVSAGVARMNAASGLYLAIDAVEPLWYPYANVGFNAYWQRKARA